jgi:hypothetical protein
MYEHRKQPLLSVADFRRRVLGHFLLALGVIAVALFIGMAGYHYLDGLPWIDALVNASMILGGMGPVDPLKSSGAKLFASFYALFSGLLFIGILGVLLAPFAHRIMHKLHLDTKEK